MCNSFFTGNVPIDIPPSSFSLQRIFLSFCFRIFSVFPSLDVIPSMFTSSSFSNTLFFSLSVSLVSLSLFFSRFLNHRFYFADFYAFFFVICSCLFCTGWLVQCWAPFSPGLELEVAPGSSKSETESGAEIETAKQCSMGGCSLLFASLSLSLFLARTHTHTYTCTYENACLSYLPFRSLFFSFLRSRAQSRTSAVSPLPTIKDHDRPLRFKFLSGWTERSLSGLGTATFLRDGEKLIVSPLWPSTPFSVIVVFPSVPFFRVFLPIARSNVLFQLKIPNRTGRADLFN